MNEANIFFISDRENIRFMPYSCRYFCLAKSQNLFPFLMYVVTLFLILFFDLQNHIYNIHHWNQGESIIEILKLHQKLSKSQPDKKMYEKLWSIF